MPALILASTSPYRRELLQRLGLAFDCARPEVQEATLPGEPPAAMARRLAREKALAVASRHPGHWVIGSDQAADLDGQPLGKPGSVAAACAQLAAMSGRQVQFHTAVCLARDGELLQACDLTSVHFRPLDAGSIARYVQREQPLDCAGSFKCEGLGISLFQAIDNQDPTALIGLPLIAVSRLLREAGFSIP
ncbi:septum formation inhibitor Maf [Stenotrophomonas ginsengisoli]|uniref:7-methyl-GTP pyrophosphatase n=1 Tax=Stenotrophomonas ginsengisoli TaxID=336566 RepID=A0A0R0DK96_9GAMM|nr:Maf family nucleotide pyrophosphatase [Stenotrophomonas ginsengisoli]KRG79154.1 septum formation inhibitor Maf [Stenotrophomonas ginsengisoli]